MPVIKRSSIEDLKARVSLYDVASQTVKLRKTGANYSGLSPFNAEKTPSFFVHPDKNIFKCFSSGKSGDVIAFVMETERLGFVEAVETLARRFNIQLEYESGGLSREERSLRQELFDIHDLAADCFHREFHHNGAHGEFIRKYWTDERRFPLDLADDFKIGFSPPDGGSLARDLLKQGFSEESMRQCGLFYQRGGKSGAASFSPRFRGRLMIPIRDHQGRIIAFTARQLEITPEDDPAHKAKYINSPETPIFSKSRILFGLDRARLAVAEEVPFVLVEGQLDALRCFHTGIKTAVAPQGTSVTEEQLSLLRRYHPRFDCLLDSDSAGQKAALRILPIALRLAMEVRFLQLPEGSDPDLFFSEHGAEGLGLLADTARHGLQFALHAYLPDPRRASPEAKVEVCRRLFEILAEAESEMLQAEYLRDLASSLQLPYDTVLNDYQHFRQARRRHASSRIKEAPAEQPANPERRYTPEADLLHICLHHDRIGAAVSLHLDHEWIDTSIRSGILLNRLLAEYEHHQWHREENVDILVENPEERDYLYSFLFEPPRFDEPAKVASAAVKRMYIRFWTRKIEEIDLEIANKSPTLDDDAIFLQRKRNEIRRKIARPPTIELDIATHSNHAS